MFGVDRRTVERTRPVGVRDRVFGVDRQRTRARESTCRRDTSEPADHQGSFSLFLSGFLFVRVCVCEALSVSIELVSCPCAGSRGRCFCIHYRL